MAIRRYAGDLKRARPMGKVFRQSQQTGLTDDRDGGVKLNQLMGKIVIDTTNIRCGRGCFELLLFAMAGGWVIMALCVKKLFLAQVKTIANIGGRVGP